MSDVPPSAITQRSRRTLCLLALLLTVVSLLSGCARVRAALAVQPDDTVTGEIVIATPATSPDAPGPEITLPPDLADEIEVSEYRQDGYAGSVLRFSGFSFRQVAELAGIRPFGERVELMLRRAGNRVIVNGKADLTTVPVDQADFQLRIAFPGEVVESTGNAEGSTASWVFTPGSVGDIGAVIAFDDPNAPSPLNWTLLMAALVALAVGIVVSLARRDRNPPIDAPRPTARR